MRGAIPPNILVLTVAIAVGVAARGVEAEPTPAITAPSLPDALIVEAYSHAATQNVLAAVNPKVFTGYFSVCADGQGFGYGNSYPSLDGHQLSDALLQLGRVDVVKANWEYIKKFQRPDGQLPLAILPGLAGRSVGQDQPVRALSRVDPNGGLYVHWVPGDPLRALAAPTYVQNADVIFRYTQDLDWLKEQLPSINRAVDHLAALTDADGGVRGAGYYVERPARIEYDGVAQCHAADAFSRAADLNERGSRPADARKYRALATRVTDHFRRDFWAGDHFAEYIHPQRGVIARHGLTDVDWSAIATGLAKDSQRSALWPRLRDEPGFDYGGMPAGIAARPETYEDWEFTTGDRHDLAAMGRVWYLQCWALARMKDGPRLLASIRKVCAVGRAEGYFWRERYTAQGGRGARKYCEYPANMIRIVQRFLMGVEFGLDGALGIAPVMPDDFWKAGVGQTVAWRGRSVSYQIDSGRIIGTYSGTGFQRLDVTFRTIDGADASATVDGRKIPVTRDGTTLTITLPASRACRFEIRVAR